MQANASDMVQARISQLKDYGVVFNVCENSLKNHQIDSQLNLYDVEESDLVNNGISKIIELQSQLHVFKTLRI